MEIEGLHNRLVKIQGQVGGIEKMMNKGASAESILVQISAIKAAIHKVGELVILEDMKERLEEAGADDESKEQAATDIKRFSALIS